MRAMILGLILLLPAAGSQALIISEYVEGNQDNQALELFHTGPGALNLGDGVNPLTSFSIELYMSGSATPTVTILLSGSISQNGVFVLANSASAALTPLADQTSALLTFSGDDAIVLRDPSGAVVDHVGVVGEDPGNQWGNGQISTKNNTLVRNLPTLGDPNISAPFDQAEWTGFSNNTFSELGTVPDVGGVPTLLLGLAGLAVMSLRSQPRS
jgi:predicted extracellular nuclease